jgi:Tol biopolymer transport system component
LRSVAPGSLLGPYQILDAIGSGGMGHVYRARDTRLNRIVAIKVLRAAVAGEPALHRRFEREARVISNLNHPHICTLHDIGEHGGVDYLVMEHLEGKTLAEILAEGRLPLSKALDYGVQISEALAAAHASGIVHRDLKPGNIMVVQSGIKVLDFGLAKFSASGGGHGAATEILTAEDIVIGTPAYMAPEQLEGKGCDHRTDIFALGLVLYEMCAGKRPFAGESRAALTAEIMKSEPPPLVDVPSQLANLVERCLAKEPADRWQSAQDLAIELRWIRQAGANMAAPKSSPGMRKREAAAWLLAVAGLSALAVMGVHSWRAGSPVSTIQFEMLPPAGATFSPVGIPAVVSPDGRYVVFRAMDRDGNPNLWVRPMSDIAARLLPGTDGVMSFFWSPDSRHVAFFSRGKLRKIDVLGGPALAINDFQGHGPGTWSRNGVILFATQTGDLFRTSENGGPIERIEALPDGGSYYLPHFLPDGQHFLFESRSGVGGGIYIRSLDKNDARLLVQGGSHALFTRPPGSAQGYLLFHRNLSMAQVFDEGRQQLNGAPFATGVGDAWDYHASANGVIVYQLPNIESNLVWMDRKGTRIGTLPGKGVYNEISLSPDESKVAVSQKDPDFANIWLIDLPRGAATRLTSERGNHWLPVWSPNGDRVAYSLWHTGKANLYAQAISGNRTGEPLLPSPTTAYSSSWSSVGGFLAYWTDSKTQHDIWIVRVGADAKPFAWLPTEHNELQPAFSPGGHWIAYTSDESGRKNVYVRKFDGGPAGSRALAVSIDGGSHPQWGRDGREIFFLSPDRKLMSVEVKGSSDLEFGPPRELFQTAIRMADVFVPYAVSRDGRRFLVITPTQENASTTLRVIVNWKPSREP